MQMIKSGSFRPIDLSNTPWDMHSAIQQSSVVGRGGIKRSTSLATKSSVKYVFGVFCSLMFLVHMHV